MSYPGARERNLSKKIDEDGECGKMVDCGRGFSSFSFLKPLRLFWFGLSEQDVAGFISESGVEKRSCLLLDLLFFDSVLVSIFAYEDFFTVAAALCGTVLAKENRFNDEVSEKR